MNIDFPCVCGCMFDNHVKVSFEGNKVAIYYCRDCNIMPPSWCYNFRPVDNLSYLEWLTKNAKS